MAEFRKAQQAVAADVERRRSQSTAWFWERIDAGLRQAFRSDARIRSSLDETLAEVDAGRTPVTVAARRLLAAVGAGERAPSPAERP